jgi:Tol biopolymer transport system component
VASYQKLQKEVVMKKLTIVLFLAVSVITLPYTFLLTTAESKEIGLLTQERSLGKRSDDVIDLVISPDCKRVAYVRDISNMKSVKMSVIVDGKESREYNLVAKGGLVFSPDSKRIAYVIEVNMNASFVVVDGLEGKSYENIGAPVFSPDSKRIAYRACTTRQFLPSTSVVTPSSDEAFSLTPMPVIEKWSVVVDGKQGKEEHDWIENPVFSPDSRRLAYVAMNAVAGRAGDYFVILDGEKGKSYNSIRSLAFSPDSKQVFYIAQRADKWLLVVDGKEGKEYDNFGGEYGKSIIFSPDGGRIAYVAQRSGKWFVVVDNEEGREYDFVGVPYFSPDGKHIGYMAAILDSKREAVVKWLAVVDKTEYEGEVAPIFGPDGNLVSSVFRDYKQVAFVINGVQEKEYDEVKGSVIFSPDSKRMAYVAKRNGKEFAVVDGMEGKEYDSVSASIFSPDSKRIVYVVERSGKTLVVIDGIEGEEYNTIWMSKEMGDSKRVVAFSSDSKHIAYMAMAMRDGEWAWFIVVDGVEGKKYDTFMSNTLVFDNPNLLYGLATRNNEILYVEVKIVEK